MTRAKRSTFSFWIPQLAEAFSHSDWISCVALALKKVEPALTGRDLNQAKKLPFSLAMNEARQDEVLAVQAKLDQQVDKFVGYAKKRIQRDWNGYILWEDEFAEVLLASKKVKALLNNALWSLANGQRWRVVAAEKAAADELMDSIWRYRRDDDWKPPFQVMFEWHDGWQVRELPPVAKTRKRREWRPEAKVPAVPKGF